MKLLLSIAALAGLSLAASTAMADDDDRRTPAKWMSVGELSAHVEKQGYTLREVERDDGVYEVEMSDDSGKRIEAHLDPVTGDFLNGPRWED